jgi:NitT/TauT family transport system substrate-binding protein
MLAGASCLGLAAFAGPAWTQSATPEVGALKLGLPAFALGFSGFVLTKAKGFWSDEGLDVSLAFFRGGNESLQALVGNAVQISVNDFASSANALQAGQDVRMLWAVENYPVFSWFLKKGETEESIRKKDRIIAATTSLGSLPQLITEHALEKLGFDMRRVVFQSVGSPAERNAAVLRGQVDIGLADVVSTLQLQEQGLVKLASWSDFVPNMTTNFVTTRREFLDKNPQTVRAFMRGLLRAIRWAKANPDDAVAVLVREYKFKPGQENYVRKAFLEVLLPGFPESGEWTAQSIEVLQQMHVKATKTAPVDPGKLLDTSIQQWFRRNPVR